MGLMPIIFTTLSIFIAVTLIVLSISYLLYRIKPRQKPYTEPKRNDPVPVPLYYSVPAKENNVVNNYRKPGNIRYNKRVKTDVNRFEILNQQTPRYYSVSESVYMNYGNNSSKRNIYDYYEDINSNTLRPVNL